MSDQRADPTSLPAWRRLLDLVHTEFVGIHPRLHAYNTASRVLPVAAAGELRARLLRWTGFSVGGGTRVTGPLDITGPRGLLPRLIIGADCFIAPNCVFDLSEQLTLGDRVTLEPGVMILTSTHELDFPHHRAGPLIRSPVTIGSGVWLRARSIILPGVKIGDGAVVEAGSVVNKDVQANSRVGGSPAVVLEQLKSGDEA
jgi:maltose O-acetyltransferase